MIKLERRLNILIYARHILHKNDLLTQSIVVKYEENWQYHFHYSKMTSVVYHLRFRNKLESEDSLIINVRLCSLFAVWTQKYSRILAPFTGTTPLPLERFQYFRSNTFKRYLRLQHHLKDELNY